MLSLEQKRGILELAGYEFAISDLTSARFGAPYGWVGPGSGAREFFNAAASTQEHCINHAWEHYVKS